MLSWPRLDAVQTRQTFRIMLLILVMHGIVQLIQIQRDDITADEEDHLIYGVAVLKGKVSRRVEGRDFRSTMPVTAIHALPRAVEQFLHPGTRKSDWGKEDIRHGRYMTLLFTLGLLAYLYCFAASLFGVMGGLASLVLAASDPNILAHGHLVTTDMAASFFCIGSLYHLYRWIDGKSQSQFMLFCIFVAMAQVAKLNNLILYPIVLLVILAMSWNQKLNYRQTVAGLAVFLLIQWFVINLVFRFDQTGFRFDQVPFKSQVITDLARLVHAPLPSPLPLAYIDTFDQIYYEIQSREGLPLNYLVGQTSMHGFWNYFLVCIGIKTPLATLMVLLLSLLLMGLRHKENRKSLVFLVMPAAIMFLFVSAASVQNGYRYALPLMTLLMISAGAIIGELKKFSRGPIMLALLLGLALAETAAFRDGFIPFTNVFVHDKKYNWNWLADSNLNWEQNHSRLNQYLRQHPEYVYNPNGPVKGMVVVHINDLAGIWEPGKYEWLTQNHKPVGELWQSYIVFDTR